MSRISWSKKLLPFACLMAASLSATAAVDLAGPTTAWLPVLQGAQFDEPTPTPNDTLDLVGDADHPLLYLQYDDAGTGDTSDDEVAFRIRVAGDGSGMLKNYLWVLVDMGGDNIIDGAIGIYSDGKVSNPQVNALFYVQTATGTTINNTALKHDEVPGTTLTDLALGSTFTFLPVSVSIDPPVTDTDLFDEDGPDYFVSFKFPWSYIEDSVAYYETQGDLPDGTTISPSTPLKMTLVSGVNHNNFPGSADFAGFPAVENPNQTWINQNALSPLLSFSTDADDDGHNDLVDNCPWDANADQLDTDNDGLGDVCDDDDDGDGVPDGDDNCPVDFNPDQLDFPDADGIGNDCDDDDDNDTVPDVDDNCPLVANPGQENTDMEGDGDACDDDYDGDTVLNDDDNCPYIPNLDQADYDSDGAGNACDDDDDNDGVDDYLDSCELSVTIGFVSTPANDNDGDGCEDAVEDDDDDNDTVPDVDDNCVLIPNLPQDDMDGDGIGDVCDTDNDDDGVNDVVDNCPYTANTLQIDSDQDGLGDVCDTVENGKVKTATRGTGSVNLLLVMMLGLGLLYRRKMV